MSDEIREVDPNDLRLPSSRATGADPWKLHQQIGKFGSSTDGMPPIFVYELIRKDELKQSIDLLRADMNANFTLLKWMVGSLIPLVVGVLIRLLFFRIP